MSNENEFPREEVSLAEALKAHVQAQMASAVKQGSDLELTQGLPGHVWEVFAWGPYQFTGGVFDPYVNPGRIIFTDEPAYVAIAVWMNPEMCTVITDHQDKILLNIWTSNMQEMTTVPALSHHCCFTTVQNGPCFYVTVWEFEPPDPACIYETNICARICNCSNNTLQDYAGFVRQVYDFDPEKLWPPFAGPPSPTWGFDRPIRFMVADPQEKCDCEPEDECGPATPLP